MVFYYIPRCYSAQIEVAGLNFRFRYTCFGIAPKHSFWATTTDKLPKWYRLFGSWSFMFNYHSAQSGRWFIFKIRLGAFCIYYLTKGEREEKGYTGLHASFNGIKKYHKIF